MRAEGIVLGAGDPNQDGLGLPMDEREDRHEVRARMEAKRTRSTSPWAGRAVAGDLAPDSKTVKTARSRAAVDPARDRDLFESKPLVPVAAKVAEAAPTPAAPVIPARAATPPRPSPKPAARRPAPAPAPTTSRAHREFDAAGIVQDYLAGKTVFEIARDRHHGVHRVRTLIKSTPGIEYRDDRKTNSGSSKKDYDPAVVAAVRRLYVDEELTQAQVAERLQLGTSKVVQTIMSRYGIPSRGDVVATGANHNAPGRSTIEHLRQQIADAGLTAAELRAWAREHGHTVAPTGLPGTEILAAYKVAQAAPVDDQPPAPCPTCSGPARETVNMVCPTCGADYALHDLADGLVVDEPAEPMTSAAQQLTLEQVQALLEFSRAFGPAFQQIVAAVGAAALITDVVAEIVKALAGPPTETQDDYTLAQGPK